jgi:tRNA(Ile)-lysidine synthase
MVAGWCSALGIEHHTLLWHPPVLTSAVQEQARNARYELLAQWCHDHSIPHLLTAHHRDDQAETLFFRLARGSGLDGLACMQPIVALAHGILLVRPLLSVSKARLVAILQQYGQEWIEDPSNQNPNYTRSRIRAAITQTGHADSICQRAYEVSASLSKFRNLLECNTARKLTLCLSNLPDGKTGLDTNAFLALEPEYGLRIITAIVKRVGNVEHTPRSEKLERFYDQLRSTILIGVSKKRTFSHCIFHYHPKKGVVAVYEEQRVVRNSM